MSSLPLSIYSAKENLAPDLSSPLNSRPEQDLPPLKRKISKSFDERVLQPCNPQPFTSKKITRTPSVRLNLKDINHKGYKVLVSEQKKRRSPQASSLQTASSPAINIKISHAGAQQKAFDLFSLNGRLAHFAPETLSPDSPQAENNNRFLGLFPMEEDGHPDDFSDVRYTEQEERKEQAEQRQVKHAFQAKKLWSYVPGAYPMNQPPSQSFADLLPQFSASSNPQRQEKPSQQKPQAQVFLPNQANIPPQANFEDDGLIFQFDDI
ncbi:hypothetical protein SCG7109_AB_00630 [Chlamydiales bacterium SCGC AG-110-M15]|nr:hypothetical protein SCG7109_AB_00630 [Chlamydiales bacterium SCGC AG-110-M15]